MANQAKRLATNVPGEFFVDATCINCDTCRQLAPRTFDEVEDLSAVRRQPQGEPEVREAFQALVACPVGSIGTLRPDQARLQEAMRSFPLHLEGEVYYNGFTSDKSFGAQSYFVRHPRGNWLIDSPRYVRTLVEAFAGWGGLRYIFLSHEDDVADAARYAARFGARRIIHAADQAAMPEAEWVIDGEDPVAVDPDFTIIPVPGHTPGSLALHYKDRYLFTGDHLSWDRATNELWLATIYVWSEEALCRSTRRLLDVPFQWVLPGHGDRIQLPEPEMKAALHRLLARRGT